MATKKTKIKEEYAPQACQPESFAETFTKLTDSPQKEGGQTALTVKPKMGRPSTYNLEIVEILCTRLSLGEGLVQICRDEDMPSQAVVYLWLNRYPDFLEKYVRAREEQAETHADEIVAIADETPQTKQIKDKSGKVIDITLDSAFIAWQKQRIDARKWNAAKQRPKKYGDSVTHKGDAENPLEMGVTMLDAFVQKLELKAQAANAE